MLLKKTRANEFFNKIIVKIFLQHFKFILKYILYIKLKPDFLSDIKKIL